MYSVGMLTRSDINWEVTTEPLSVAFSVCIWTLSEMWKSTSVWKYDWPAVWTLCGGAAKRDQGKGELIHKSSMQVMKRGKCSWVFGKFNAAWWVGLEMYCKLYNLPRLQNWASHNGNWDVIERKWIWTVSEYRCGRCLSLENRISHVTTHNDILGRMSTFNE